MVDGHALDGKTLLAGAFVPDRLDRGLCVTSVQCSPARAGRAIADMSWAALSSLGNHTAIAGRGVGNGRERLRLKEGRERGRYAENDEKNGCGQF